MSPFMLLSLLLTGILVCFAVPSEAVGGRLGGLEPAYADEDGVIRAAHFATAELDKMSNALYASKLTDIKSAEKQVGLENFPLSILYYSFSFSKSGMLREQNSKMNKSITVANSEVKYFMWLLCSR